MRRFTLLFYFFSFVTSAMAQPLDDALRATYMACVGIDDELADLKKMAGINTVVTSVGTAAGAGATTVGLVKTKKDAKLQKILDELKQEEIAAQQGKEQTDIELDVLEQQYVDMENLITQVANGTIKIPDETWKEIGELQSQSKKLGNWRTGLMAGSAATNIAGAIIAGTNRVKGDLETQINDCKASIKQLRDAIMQARMNGQDISEAQSIVDACGDFEYSDLSKINKRATGAAISSGIGATTGLVGTITSASANSNDVRGDNSEAGRQKEKNLNTASNILAGTTAAASVTATVFNATQIKAIKQVAEVASKCTGVLK